MGLPTGLIMTLVTGAELFTGNTALVTGALMEGKIKKKDLAKNWVASYIGNFVGSVLLAWL
jgi:formate/nitrite transporter FocA (FNT family)